jgi:hypothetical protein
MQIDLLLICWESTGIPRSEYELRYVLVDEFPIPGTSVRLYLHSLETAVGSSPTPILWVPRIKRLGPRADKSFLFISEAKNMWSHASTPQYAFMK